MKQILTIALLLSQYTPPPPPPNSGLPTPPAGLAYLQTNAGVKSWSNVVTGGSGALDCSTVPGQCDILTDLVPLKQSSNTWTGANDFSQASILILAEKLTTDLPDPVAFNHAVFIVTDSMAQNSCSSGGGNKVAICRSNGTAWEALGVGQ